ncbi:PepSY domain-containing protein [Agrobacterium pusense]|uniref:PepSY domain-containing protein n=1 Tax=Agrobacterium pusense TaxID=648995 RepID=UPI003FD41035
MRPSSATRLVGIIFMIALLCPAYTHVSAYAQEEGSGASEGGGATDGGEQGESENTQSDHHPDGDHEDPNGGGESTKDSPGSELWDFSTESHPDGIVSLDTITEQALKLTDGRILDVELRSRPSGFKYELRVLETDDRLRRYTFDARSGRLIGVK